MPHDERRLAWAYLSRVIEGPSRTLSTLLASGKEVEAIATAVKKREPWIGDLLAETASRYDWNRAAQDLDDVAALGGRMITPDDAEWPSEALDSAFSFAASGMSEHIRSYQSDAIAPHVLWVKGAPLRPLTAQAVTIVGTRALSNYGRNATALLTRGLVQHSWTIVSGGALGVDTVAHEEALAQGGSTIVVQACGLDRTYPSANTRLFRAIGNSAHSALVTEYPPGVNPQRHRFLTRNRLSAALSLGTVVTQAAWRSGALNTLSWAAGLGKVAMAVPGPITDTNSFGCLAKIRDGDAQMVCSADEIRALLSAVGEIDVDAQYELDFAANPIQKLSRNEMRVFDALCAQPQSATTIAENAGLTVGLTMHLLLELERKALIQRQRTNWVRHPNFKGY
ncbi:MAG: DNA-processing protein DprA [Corynebacterium sp.]|uniref:DNA-processing protein DprA n=1 Tax=Corynebacterium sp. TaxID=1720 RepID=UPI0026DD7855|nr:DNA-processing protein DprA [Corynebacterium sp.]MDO4762281.1 DNA-processing protein DprA [Corynebacterium sp.]